MESCMLEQNKCPNVNINSFYLLNVVGKKKNLHTQIFNFWSQAYKD